MKLVFVGGGSLRILGIARGIMAVPGLMTDGEICLYDLAEERSDTMGRMLQKTPECAESACAITWNLPLERALEGADAVAVIMPAGEPRSTGLAADASVQAGFMHSDNLSPLGAMLGVRIGPVLLSLARKMEQICPQAVLLDFVNPVAVMSALINNHTHIRCFGVCAGFSNHLWDLSRLFGADESATVFDGETAGVNHLSYIVRGTWQGEELFSALDRVLNSSWTMPELQSFWSTGSRENITRSVTRLADLYKSLGVLVFSTEGDGLAHLQYDAAVANQRQHHRVASSAEREAAITRGRQARAEEDRTFRGYLSQELDARFWDEHWRNNPIFRRVDDDIFCVLITGLGGVRPVKVATSRPNRGAIEGIGERDVVEYSHYVFKDKVWPAGRFTIPPVVNGLTSALSTHQTMLADAIATGDPRLLAQALLAYPIQMYTQQARTFYKELISIYANELAAPLRTAGEYL